MVRTVHVSYKFLLHFYICRTYEGMHFVTFVQESLYPKGNNAPKDEGL